MWLQIYGGINIMPERKSNIMKRMLILFLAGMLCFSAVGCTGETGKSDKKTEASKDKEKDKDKDRKPQLSDLRDSGAIEQDADVVALLHRTLAKQQQQGEDDDNGLQAELIVAKNRNGRIGVEKLVFFPQFTLYEQGSEVADEDVPR